MKAIMVMFDSLNRHMLSPYGCDWTVTPNFERLAAHSVTFTNAWVGSMPCMPARRELLTGRYNFLHRSWGPLEPFDDSMPRLLVENGIYTHLISDHYHYWEAGGATYHTQYSTWEFIRGQEGDPWKGEVGEPSIPDHVGRFEGHRKRLFRQDWINRKYMATEDLHPQAKTFRKGLEFIDKNAGEDNWFLQIEAFDPHEPFFAPPKYKSLYEHDYLGPHFDWPGYKTADEPLEQIEHCKYEYAALLSMCDTHLGLILDKMDELNLWEDTMLIVNTDHGFLLGEHGWWAKNIMPFYNEIARIPMFIWDPRYKRKNVKCDSLVQMIDMAPTILRYFNVPIPKDVTGRPIEGDYSDGTHSREAILFGIFGGHVNCTDGRYVYMKAPALPDVPLYEYTLMPSHMTSMFGIDELSTMQLCPAFSFTKGLKTLKIQSSSVEKRQGLPELKTLLFDLEKDPAQTHSICDSAIENKMIDTIKNLFKENDAPSELYQRFGIS